MLSIGSAHQLWLYGEAVDFRKGFDGLCGVVRDQMGRDPLSGEVFIFINRRRNKLKLLLWEKGGLVLWYKRLEEGQFEWLEGVKGGKQLSYLQLGMLIEGVSLEGRKARKRYQKKG